MFDGIGPEANAGISGLDDEGRAFSFDGCHILGKDGDAAKGERGAGRGFARGACSAQSDSLASDGGRASMQAKGTVKSENEAHDRPDEISTVVFLG